MSKGNQPRPTLSFAQALSKAQLEALKPYIDAQIQEVRRTLAMQHLAGLADLTVRMSAIEKVLFDNNLTTKEAIKELRRDLEDESYGIKTTTEPAEENDYVRMKVQATYMEFDKDGKELGGKALDEQEIDVPQLTPDARQAHPKILEGVIGMTAGQEKDVEYEAQSPRGKVKVTAHVKISRVSRAPKTEAAPDAKGA